MKRLGFKYTILSLLIGLLCAQVDCASPELQNNIHRGARRRLLQNNSTTSTTTTTPVPTTTTAVTQAVTTTPVPTTTTTTAAAQAVTTTPVPTTTTTTAAAPATTTTPPPAKQEPYNYAIVAIVIPAAFFIFCCLLISTQSPQPETTKVYRVVDAAPRYVPMHYNVA